MTSVHRLGTLNAVTTTHSPMSCDPIPARLVALEAVHNFRDLGGYPTADGRTHAVADAVSAPTACTG